jgi:ketosteroid isomerase-like protein
MMRSILASILLSALIGLAACAPAPSPAPDSGPGPDAATLARSGYEAFARGDIEGVLALMDDELVWHEAASLPYGGIHLGPQTVLERVFGAIAGDWDAFSATPERYIDGGDSVVVLGTYRGVHRRSGGQLEVPFAHVWRVHDGRLVEFHQFTDTALWLRAATGPETP